MTDKLPPVPLTEDGLDVLIDLFEASLRGVGDAATSDPTAIREWGAKALQAGAWPLIESTLSFFAGTADPHRTACVIHTGERDCDCGMWDLEGRLGGALSRRAGGMPQSLEDALLDGWVGIRCDDAGAVYWLCVEQREHWWQWCLLDTGEPRVTVLLGGDDQRWIRRPDATLLRSIPFRDLPEEKKGELLAVWPEVVAWEASGGPGPWERPPRMTVGQLCERLGVRVHDESGARNVDDVTEELSAALDALEPDERALAMMVLARVSTTAEGFKIDVSALADFMGEVERMQGDPRRAP